MDVLLCCCRSGQQKQGPEMGPHFIMKKILPMVKHANTYTISDREFTTDAGYQAIYDHSVSCKNKLLTLGGDHSIGLPTVMASLHKFKKKLKVIWVDAHADINTNDSSESKNTHGMPCSPLFGLMKPWIKTQNDLLLDPSQFVYIGLRSVDGPEEQFIRNLGIKSYYSSDVKKIGIEHVMKQIMENDKSDTVYHLSFDIDGLCSSVCPSTGTPENNGLTLWDGQYIIKTLNDTTRLRSFDLVEYNPLIGNDKDNEKTIDACVQLISGYLGKATSKL
jgi:arginase